MQHIQSGVTLTDLAYSYGPDGQLTEIVDKLDPSNSKAISYDLLNRLVQVAEGIPAAQGGTPIPVEDYAYDEEGNRTASHLSALYSSNAHNQLTEDEDYTYAYDSKGNRISRTSKVSGEVEAHTYDSQNRLVGYASPTTPASYAYDALDRRVAKTVDGTVTAYVYDMSTDDPLAYDDIVEEWDATDPTLPVLARRWQHSQSVDEPVGFEDYPSSSGVGSGLERAVFADRQGSVICVTEPASGDVVAGYEYDGYGAITQTAGSLVQPYGYMGREYDAESGLYFNRARVYDPVTGRFLQSDPFDMIDGSNLYAYAANDPINWSDPLGTNQTATMSFGTGLTAAGAGARAEQVFTGAITLAGRINALLRTITLATRPGAEAKVVTVNPLPPPGDCYPDEHARLEEQKDLRESITNSCKSYMSYFQLARNEYHFRKLARIRQQINSQCFRGGDEGHIEARDNAIRAAENCIEHMKSWRR